MRPPALLVVAVVFRPSEFPRAVGLSASRSWRPGVNGVLMVWYKCSHIQQLPADKYEVEVYLIEVAGDRVVRSKEGFLDADRAISNVFDQFFAASRITSS